MARQSGHGLKGVFENMHRHPQKSANLDILTAPTWCSVTAGMWMNGRRASGSGSAGAPAPAGGRRVSRRGTALLVFLAIVVLLCGTVSAAGTAVPDTQYGIASRQAHLSWTALEKETEMKTAIGHVTTLFGTDTSNMSVDLAAFQAEEARIPGAGSDAELAALLQDMKNTTALFRNETFAQMTTGQGKWEVLDGQISTATANSPYIAGKQSDYWNTRKTGTLADFDAWVANGQQVLDGLKLKGYDTAIPQRTLDVISARRPDIQSALESRSEIAITTLDQQLFPQTLTFSSQVAAVRGQVPGDRQQQFLIDQGYRAVGRADLINHDLTLILIDIGPADTILSQTKTDLDQSRKILATGNLEAAKTPLRLVQKDFVDLAQAYRDVAHSADLPPALSAELLSMAIRLDDAADQMGAVL